MRLSKIAWLTVIVVVGAILVFSLSGGSREHRLADGSILRLEKIGYEKHPQVELGGLLEQARRRLPRFLAQHFSAPASTGTRSWYLNATIRTNEDALFIYLTRRDAVNG